MKDGNGQIQQGQSAPQPIAPISAPFAEPVPDPSQAGTDSQPVVVPGIYQLPTSAAGTYATVDTRLVSAPAPVPQAAPVSAEPSAPQDGYDATMPAPACQVPAETSRPAASPVNVVVPPAKRGLGWLVAIVLILCVTGLAAFSVYSCSRVVGGDSLMPPVLQDDTVAFATLEGTIAYDGSACSPDGFGALLDTVEQTPQIQALVLRVNSGGGSAAAGEEMALALKDFPKPVVVNSAGMNASAAYEISSQADYIYVGQSTEIGSIGARMELMDYSGLMRLLGIDVVSIASADSKDSSSGYRPLTDEERAHYQHMVDQINDAFVKRVAEGRHMSEDAVRQLANGLVYTGTDAVQNGLADAIGTKEDALDKAAALAGLDSYRTYDMDCSTAAPQSIADILGI